MPIIEADGCQFNVDVRGAADAHPLMLCNSLGTDLHMWDAQADIFSRHFRLIRYDCRGHGLSSVTPGPYTMERLGQDALAVMDALGLATVHWCGLSMGGMVGQWLGAHAPQRIARLILADTSAYYPDKRPWNERIATVREHGIAAIADNVLKLWFTADYRAREIDETARMKAMMLATPRDGYIACCEAVRDMDHRDILRRIAAPTHIIAGRHDFATTITNAEFIRGEVAGATLSVLDAAHISNVEAPDAFARDVLRCLGAPS